MAWYEDAVFYEIYVRGFADSDGDGHGDLAGLVDKLDYVRDLGVDGSIATRRCSPPSRGRRRSAGRASSCGSFTAAEGSARPEMGRGAIPARDRPSTD